MTTATLYRYRCTAGHAIESPKPLASCPACVRGESCAGTLNRYGPGSRTR